MTRIRHWEASRYWVPSDTDPETPWLVDLDALSGAGECACSEFWHRAPETRCHHIEKARKFAEKKTPARR